MNFCAHEMANILQNASQNRDIDHRKITVDDIKNAMAAAYMSIFPGKTMYPISAHVLPRGIGPFAALYCVKGLGGGRACVLWRRAIYTVDSCCNPSKITVVDCCLTARTLVTASTNANASDICPGLKIENGEIKIIVECTIFYNHKDQIYKFTDGRWCKDVPPSKAFGFSILTPADKNSCYFNSIVIFTPKPGLFSETAPK
jgi:hypothetical protein